MPIADRTIRTRGRTTGRLVASLLAATAVAGIAGASGDGVARAQDLGLGQTEVASDAPLFLEADTVTYDSDNAVVTADGGVQIDYGDNRLVAREVTYDQDSRRLIASGDVELRQPDGTTVYADRIDVTDDFRDGFVQALRIETAANTRFAARDAVREEGTQTTFNRGVYTACEACAEHPERAPLWQVKARKIVWDQSEQEIRYYGAQFELFGAPIAYLPYFRSPDPSVQRKSGFLAPSFVASNDLGYGARVPYFITIGDDRDVTLAGTYYSKQGFLAEAEYRQAFRNGGFTLKTAGIIQQDPDAFADDNRPGRFLSPDFDNEERGMIGTRGRFALSDRWELGWDVLVQSDNNFSNTYGIQGYDDSQYTSSVYLTGLGDQSFFDLRAQDFQYQSVNPRTDEVQPFVAPSFDYQRIEQEPVLGGEVEFNANLASIYRDQDDVSGVCSPEFLTRTDDGVPRCAAPGRGEAGSRLIPGLSRASGLEGSYTRASADLKWRDRYTTSWGLVVRPTLGLRADAYTADMESDGFTNVDRSRDPARFTDGAYTLDDSGTRGMATAAIEARYPYHIRTANTDHVIEPIGQLIVRPNEMNVGDLPNEDAQTLAFSTANLFSLDKFSGYDRIEGGTRANVGVRYQGRTDSGYGLDAVVGQSYHLAGDNPFDVDFADPDTALVGADTGLEDDVSDYVGSAALMTPVGVSLGTAARVDKDELDLERGDVFTSYNFDRGSLGASYSSIAAQPIAASPIDRQQVGANASLNFAENWEARGSFEYDLENETIINRTFSVGYADECFSLIATYRKTNDAYTTEVAQETIGFKLGLRTISDFNQSFDLGGA